MFQVTLGFSKVTGRSFCCVSVSLFLDYNFRVERQRHVRIRNIVISEEMTLSVQPTLYPNARSKQRKIQATNDLFLKFLRT